MKSVLVHTTDGRRFQYNDASFTEFADQVRVFRDRGLIAMFPGRNVLCVEVFEVVE
jgi:hypothetical protein